MVFSGRRPGVSRSTKSLSLAPTLARRLNAVMFTVLMLTGSVKVTTNTPVFMSRS